MAVRNASKAVESPASRGSVSSGSAFGGSRVQKRGVVLRALMSRFSRRTTTSSIRPPHRGAHLAGAGEAHRVEHLQEPRERARVSVVGRGGEEEAVLELRSHQPQHAAQLAVLAERRGHQVVAFVHDQQIPGKMR